VLPLLSIWGRGYASKKTKASKRFTPKALFSCAINSFVLYLEIYQWVYNRVNTFLALREVGTRGGFFLGYPSEITLPSW